jgi:hypothetical protein
VYDSSEAISSASEAVASKTEVAGEVRISKAAVSVRPAAAFQDRPPVPGLEDFDAAFPEGDEIRHLASSPGGRRPAARLETCSPCRCVAEEAFA